MKISNNIPKPNNIKHNPKKYFNSFVRYTSLLTEHFDFLRYRNMCRMRLASEKFVLASESNLSLATGLAG